MLKYNLRESDNVISKVYNLMGKEVITLVDERQTSGNYKVIWDGRDRYGKEVSSGTYFYELRAGSYSQIRKMVLSR